MRKVISLLLIVIIAASALSACESNIETDTAVTAAPSSTYDEGYVVPDKMPEKSILTEEEQKEVHEMNGLKAEMDKNHFGDVLFMDPISPLSEIKYYPVSGEHPRVYVNQTTLTETYSKLHLESNAEVYKAYSENKEKFDTNESTIEAKAFAYLVEGDTLKGYEAIYLYEQLLSETPVSPPDRASNDSDTRGKGSLMNLGAKVYDWCNDLLTAEDKEMIYAGCQNILAPYMEIGVPPSAENQSTIASHSSEAQLLRDWLALAIAVYDDYPNAYDYVGSRFFAEYVPFRNYYYESDYIHQGTSYGAYRFGFDLYSDWLMQAMTGGEHVYTDNIENIIVSWAYLIRPDGWLMRQGDDGKQSRYEYIARNSIMITGLYKNGYAKTLADKYGPYLEECLSLCEYLIINDPFVEGKPLSELPLAIYNGSPLGQIIARTGWDTDDIYSDDITVLMKIGESYVVNHDHFDSGSFQIYYKGSLAIDSGSKNSSDYTVRTVAHNSLLVGTEKDFNSLNYGGQRFFGAELVDWTTWNMTGNKRVRVPNRVIAHEISTTDTKLGYAYIAGDLSKSYTGAQEVYRSMMFIPVEDDDGVKGLFFVFDKLTTKTEDHKKVFLLHMREEPTVSDNVITVTVTDGEYNGRLVDQILEPDGSSVCVDVIGGPGKNELLDGKNYGDSIDYSDYIDKGWGRIEVSTTGNKTSYFLNVMTIGDADGSEVPEAVLYETDTHAASKILDTVVVYNKSFAASSDEFTIGIDSGEEELTYYVAGVSAGNWSIAVGDKTIAATATEDGCMLVFNAPAGELTFTKR